MSEIARFFMTVTALLLLHWLNSEDVRSANQIAVKARYSVSHSWTLLGNAMDVRAGGGAGNIS